jgi:NAD(P)-dependent dehydrogenase (short-subunit alcohol dehydrogenase family)
MGGAYSVPDKQTKYLHEFMQTMPDMSGKKVAITGTTSGLGFVAARECLRKGATVYLLNRPSERSKVSLSKLQSEAGSDKVSAVDCDLQSFAAVRQAAREVTMAVASSGLDVLCNNAGASILHIEQALERSEVLTCPCWLTLSRWSSASANSISKQHHHAFQPCMLHACTGCVTGNRAFPKVQVS